MSERDPDQRPQHPAGTPRKRIETQIHRRRKVKASFPLEAEWESESGKTPDGLRTPANKMKK